MQKKFLCAFLITTLLITMLPASIFGIHTGEEVSDTALIISQDDAITAFSLPPLYDPRSLNPPLTTPIKNQGGSNNCWIYSSVATLEIHQRKKNGTIRSYSEDYYDYRKSNNGFHETNLYDLGMSLNTLGMSVTVSPAFNLMVNWQGPVLESEFPYNYEKSGKISISAMNITPDVHVYGYEIIPPNSNSSAKIAEIKEAIYNNGAVTFGNWGHSMTIVGWNDNHDGGSWLLRDSYGLGSGDNGYQWTKYTNNGNMQGGGWNFSVNHIEPVGKYFKNYHHFRGTNTHSEFTGTNTVSLASVFDRERSDESISAVGFSTLHPNTKYEIYVNTSGNTLNSSSLVRVAEGTAEKPGYRTIPFASRNITGAKFAVAVRFTLPSGVTTFSYEAERVISGAVSGQCFYNTSGSLDSGWADAATPYLQNASVMRGTRLPIRAYTNINGTPQTPTPTPTPTHTPTPTPKPTESPDYGDVNADGVISAADVTLLRRYIAATNKDAFTNANNGFNERNADVNGDGIIDLADVTLLRRYLAATDQSTVPLGPQLP